jgi:uncharacterized protein YndB with AHSA1/START domain
MRRAELGGDRQVSVERVISAPAAAIFDLLADPSMHPLIDGSGTVQAERGHSKRLELGARFSMQMRRGVPYPITNTVVEFEPDRRIAWAHFFGHRWRYELTPLSDEGAVPRTRVVETFDYSTARLPQAIELGQFPRKNLPGMARSLERLDRLVTSSAAS